VSIRRLASILTEVVLLDLVVVLWSAFSLVLQEERHRERNDPRYQVVQSDEPT
jgi:hypothetical protein